MSKINKSYIRDFILVILSLYALEYYLPGMCFIISITSYMYNYK